MYQYDNERLAKVAFCPLFFPYFYKKNRSMKTTSLAIATLFASIAVAPVAATAQPRQLSTGDNLPAMETTMKNVNGQSTTLKAAAKANGLLVMFSCNTCPFVIKNQPVTNKTIAYA